MVLLNMNEKFSDVAGAKFKSDKVFATRLSWDAGNGMEGKRKKKKENCRLFHFSTSPCLAPRDLCE
jgi:hypothetical protein